MPLKIRCYSQVQRCRDSSTSTGARLASVQDERPCPDQEVFSDIEFQNGSERRYLVLNGLYVEERWRTCRTVPVVVTVLFLTLVVSRLVWNSWEVVFGATSFVATAIMLVHTMYDS